jgi:hypothetical protein
MVVRKWRARKLAESRARHHAMPVATAGTCNSPGLCVPAEAYPGEGVHGDTASGVHRMPGMRHSPSAIKAPGSAASQAPRPVRGCKIPAGILRPGGAHQQVGGVCPTGLAQTPTVCSFVICSATSPGTLRISMYPPR